MSNKNLEDYKRFAFRHAAELFAWYGKAVCELTEEQIEAWSDLRDASAPRMSRSDVVKVRVVNPSILG